jgi:chromosome segregation protein
MRLSKIKLAGFKSFVDPTTLNLPGNLTGIVGPNGCGKSNTIDAVRWVMGESSAKHLRGESMDDVIFSGSSARKPVGQASVELVFDNSAGKLGGQYAQFTEISVKRQVTRDGQSQYFLNAARCRRRDITDIFLGTGLGPRSYAIIEQGMISRLIEARPEDMRVYIEEAAGISRYKERRRETENRIRHTRDNLDRLNDLREEVDKQLAHLQRQSKMAERYKTLKVEEKQLRAELLGLRWQEYQDALGSFDKRLAERNEAVEVAEAGHAEAEQAIENMRTARGEMDAGMNRIQASYYQLGADITRIEQTIEHQRSQREARERDIARVIQELAEAEQNIVADRNTLAEIERGLADAGPARARYDEAFKSISEVCDKAESDFQQWREDREQLGAEQTEQAKLHQIEAARASQLEKNIGEASLRRERLQRELADLEDADLAHSLAELTEERDGLAAQETQLRDALQRAGQALHESRERESGNARELDECRTQLQSASGRLASLEALQQAALGGAEKNRLQWLEQHGLTEAPQLARMLSIDAGWEKAAEVVLGDFLEAVCVDDMDTLRSKLAGQPESGIKAVQNNADEDDADQQPWLASVVSSTAGIAELLHGITVCESLEEAMQAREQLQPGESLVTRDGVWMGRHWLCVRPQENGGGVLARQEELDALKTQSERLRDRVDTLESQHQDLEAAVVDCEQQRDKLQAVINARHRDISTLNGKIESTESQIRQSDARTLAVRKELDEVTTSVRRVTVELDEARSLAAEAGEQSAELDQQIESQEVSRAALLARRDQARAKLEEVRQDSQQALVKLESMKSVRESTANNLQRMEQQRAQLLVRQEELGIGEDAEDDETETLAAQQEELQQARDEVERELAQARRSLEQHDEALRQRDRDRSRLQQELTEATARVQQVKMESQEARVRLKTIDEQLAESGVDRAELMPQIPHEATVESWQTRIEELERRIQRLGPINLAAIEEYREQVQRKEYLDEQHEDITQALETLEEAIRKIDRETKALFRETFDIVNSKLQELFPRLFGGGQAMRLFTEDPAVIARPPGKRVSSIHLLSGGEKAMTAVALVFAFFHLRPSPFCMLDEVDAPLDDANVGRFAKMVSEMSSQVQFIFITHNKATMEMSTHLMGVTMQEPGVSRLVAVDVDEAVELAVA